MIKTNACLKSAGQKTETEGLITAALIQSLATRKYQTNIIKNEWNPIYRLWEQKTEPTDYLVFSCPTLTLIEYKKWLVGILTI